MVRGIGPKLVKAEAERLHEVSGIRGGVSSRATFAA
jgi:hypothetical protein